MILKVRKNESLIFLHHDFGILPFLEAMLREYWVARALIFEDCKPESHWTFPMLQRSVTFAAWADNCTIYFIDIDETMLTEKAANAETTIREKTEIETTEVDSVTVKQCSEIGEIHSEGTKASAELSKGDAVSEESKDEHSFEILSPEKCKQEEKESDCSDKSEKTGDRRLTEGGLRSSSSDHSSPGKEDSSSNSSVEVIQKSSDNVTRSLPHVNTEDNGERAHVRGLEETRADHSETASTGSWISVDDELRVRRSKHEKFINDKESDVDPFKSPGMFCYGIFSVGILIMVCVMLHRWDFVVRWTYRPHIYPCLLSLQSSHTHMASSQVITPQADWIFKELPIGLTHSL